MYPNYLQITFNNYAIKLIKILIITSNNNNPVTPIRIRTFSNLKSASSILPRRSARAQRTKTRGFTAVKVAANVEIAVCTLCSRSAVLGAYLLVICTWKWFDTFCLLKNLSVHITYVSRRCWESWQIKEYGLPTKVDALTCNWYVQDMKQEFLKPRGL